MDVSCVLTCEYACIFVFIKVSIWDISYRMSPIPSMQIKTHLVNRIREFLQRLVRSVFQQIPRKVLQVTLYRFWSNSSNQLWSTRWETYCRKQSNWTSIVGRRCLGVFEDCRRFCSPWPRRRARICAIRRIECKDHPACQSSKQWAAECGNAAGERNLELGQRKWHHVSNASHLLAQLGHGIFLGWVRGRGNHQKRRHVASDGLVSKMCAHVRFRSVQGVFWKDFDLFNKYKRKKWSNQTFGLFAEGS